MNKYIPFIFSLFLIVGCTQKNETDYLVTIHTHYGDMVAILYDETPKHKENFIKLVNSHFYDNLLFHRVIPNFMIQGGDPYSRNAPRELMLGLGGPGYEVDAEFSPNIIHEKGTLSAARLRNSENPMKASHGSQFFIVQGVVISPDQAKSMNIDAVQAEAGYKIFAQNPENKVVLDSLLYFEQVHDLKSRQELLTRLAPQIEKQTGVKIMKNYTPAMVTAYTTVGGLPNLDGEYTAFGKVIKGLEIIDSIGRQPTHLEDRPVKDIPMSITIEQKPREEITKEFGYVYPTKISD